MNTREALIISLQAYVDRLLAEYHDPDTSAKRHDEILEFACDLYELLVQFLPDKPA